MIQKLYKELLSKPKVAVSLMVVTVLMVVAIVWAPGAEAQSPEPVQSGAVGIEGTVPSDPPSTGAIISFPINNQTFTDVPIDVTGVCPAGLLVKVFKNEVFAGSAECSANGTFTLQIDLFSGDNTLVARVFDDLDQPGPDSNTVNVIYNDGNDIGGVFDRLILTTNFAKRGANPGSTLRWPFSITGGNGPYAIVVDWGDGQETIISQEFAGEFNAEHSYERPGTYKVVVKATDADGNVTYLQVVGVGNGALTTDTGETEEIVPTRIVSRFVVWPMYILLFLILSTFWLGRRYEKRRIKKRLERSSNVRY